MSIGIVTSISPTATSSADTDRSTADVQDCLPSLLIWTVTVGFFIFVGLRWVCPVRFVMCWVVAKDLNLWKVEARISQPLGA